jgi:hypothetical protein
MSAPSSGLKSAFKQVASMFAGLSLGLFFGPEEGGGMFFRNIA